MNPATSPSLFGLVFVTALMLAVYLLMCVRILQEYERGVIFRLGRLRSRPKGPGVILVFKPIDRMVRVSLRTIALDVPPQDIITRDNVSVHVNAVVYFQVVDPARAICAVEDYLFATSQMAQTTLRSVLGQQEMDDLLTEREKLNLELQTILDRQTEPWGVKVNTVEIKKVDLPQEMQRAMARQAEAERERRAKIIGAEGEYQSAEKLVMAADMMGQHPMAMQMRYLQTLVEISAEKSSTIIFPVPMEMLKVFGGLKETIAQPRGPEPEPSPPAKVETIPPRL
jgi:regulator of protease activity HflC (stomatin/prohibitin superfamily)